MTSAAAELEAVATVGPPAALVLEPNDVHVWRVDVDALAEADAELVGLLAPDERRRADRFRTAPDRRRFVVTRATLRSLLGRYLGADPHEVPIQYGVHGKPELRTASSRIDLAFNLAHSGDLVLFAFARDRRVGIDVEAIRPVPELDLLAQRLFTPRERGVLDALEGCERSIAFFHGWTRKEAFAKALGQGLTLAFERVAVPMGANAMPAAVPVEAIGVAGRWWLHPLDVRPGYVAAVAVEGDGHRVGWRR